MKSVFLLWHPDGESEGKLIGVYEGKREAELAIGRIKIQPGFVDYPNGFTIDEYPLNKDHWVDGFTVG